jgi:hypothetical protein
LAYERTQPDTDPTPHEIAQRCAGIRSGWSASEEQRRRCYGFDARWQPPSVPNDPDDTADEADAMERPYGDI